MKRTHLHETKAHKRKRKRDESLMEEESNRANHNTGSFLRYTWQECTCTMKILLSTLAWERRIYFRLKLLYATLSTRSYLPAKTYIFCGVIFSLLLQRFCFSYLDDFWRSYFVLKTHIHSMLWYLVGARYAATFESAHNFNKFGWCSFMHMVIYVRYELILRCSL